MTPETLNPLFLQEYVNAMARIPRLLFHTICLS